MSKPWRWNGYEIDREDIRKVERLIATYPHRKKRLEMLRAKWAGRVVPDYHTYRSPQAEQTPRTPGRISDPTAAIVMALDAYEADMRRIAYLEKWIEAFEMVLYERLDAVQRRLVTDYLMVPKNLREANLVQISQDLHASKTQCYYWLNGALLEFAFLFLDEDQIRTFTGKTPEKEMVQAG